MLYRDIWAFLLSILVQNGIRKTFDHILGGARLLRPLPSKSATASMSSEASQKTVNVRWEQDACNKIHLCLKYRDVLFSLFFSLAPSALPVSNVIIILKSIGTCRLFILHTCMAINL